jgi:hypothetical protein
MITEIETQNEKDEFWNPYSISEEDYDALKKQVNDDPLISRKTKVMRIEYNIRYIDAAEAMVHCDTVAIQCKDGSSEDEELMFNGITSPDCCLMSYDVEGICPKTEKTINYDLAIVRTEKPKEYWAKHFK